MIYKFEPKDEKDFMEMAVGNKIQTIVTDSISGQEIINFTRKVKSVWSQTMKNNIQSDHRIKQLVKIQDTSNFIVYTYIL